MERTEEIRSGVPELISSTNLSLPVGAVTYPGSFEERAEAYIVAQELGIRTGVAYGFFTYMYSNEDCETVQEYIRKRRVSQYYAD